MLDDRYEIRQLLGHGGMGRVWLAWDSTLHRKVAIKEMTPSPGNVRRRSR
jgi:serine/threonine protein kinase